MVAVVAGQAEDLPNLPFREDLRDLPEYRTQEERDMLAWSANPHQRGLVGYDGTHVITVPEENLLCFENDIHKGSQLIVNNVAGTMMEQPMKDLYPDYRYGYAELEYEVRLAYDDACRPPKKLFTGTNACNFSYNVPNEYFGHISMAYWNVKAETSAEAQARLR
ncbi:hypothetical protein CYMTET_36943, partial [Cymbomonas tetramitiformis]